MIGSTWRELQAGSLQRNGLGVRDFRSRRSPRSAARSDFYEDRLKLIEAYDRAGIYGYHCAEHHSTPLGMAPSPSVFLAAVAQRTKRLRFGPLVYTLALYHPLRLAEEICMLDQMSRGRFLLGIGKGISPIEVGYYGVDFKNADKMFAESLRHHHAGADAEDASISRASSSASRTCRWSSSRSSKPHPPLWYGVVNPDSAERAAKAGMNFISNSTAAMVKAKVARYSAALISRRPRQPRRSSA